MDVGSLRAELELDATQFRRDLDQAGNQFRQLAKEADRNARATAGAFRSAGQDAQRGASGIGDAFHQEGTRAEQAASGIGGAFREAGSRAEGAAGGIGAAFQQEGARAENAASGIGGAFRQAGADGEQAASGIGGAFERAMERGQAAGEGAGASSGGSFVAAFGTRIAALGGRAGPIGLALGAAVGVGALFGAKLADTVYDGFQIQAQRDFAQASFGLTDTQMAVYGEAAGGAYGNAWGESVAANIDTAGIAVQAGIIGGDATAAEMQPLIEQLTFVSSIMGEEIPAVARAAGQMIKTNMVETPAEAMDLLTAAQQRGLNLNEDILDTMNEYGTQYRKLGIDGPAAMGLIAQAVEGGARDADIAADAFKEFSLRVLDIGNEDVTGAFETLGFNVEETSAAFGRGGEEAFNMADQVMDALRKIEDPVERNALGISLFGTQWEDMGDAINKMDLTTARDELTSTGKTLEAMDQASGNAAGAMQEAKNKITVAADEVKMKLAEAFAPAATDAANWVGEHQDEIVLFLAEVASTAIDVTAGLLDAGGAALQFGAMLAEGGVGMIDGFLRPLLATAEAMADVIENVPGMGGVADGIKSAVDKTRGLIDGLHDGAEAMNKGGSAMFTLADKIRNGTATLDDFILAQQQSIQETDSLEQKATALGDTLNLLPRDKAIDISTPGGIATRDLLTELGVKVNTDNNKNIVVESPLAPEVLAVLDQLGIKVRNDNGKNIIVTSNAPGVKVDIDNLATAVENVRSVKDIEFRTLITGEGASTTPRASGTNVMPPVPGMPRAHGGPISGPGGPKGDKILTPTSDGEWVIQAPAVDFYGEQFFADLNAMRLGVPRADGGPVTAVDVRSAISGLDGASYAFGGWDGTWNTDCSGAQAKAANWATTGDTETGGRFATANMAEALAARGYQPGQAPAGVPAIEHGWYNGGEGGGHAAGLIQDPMGGDTPFEMGGNAGGGAVGAGASSSRDIGATDYAWLPLGSEDPNATGSGSLGSQSQIPGTSTPGVYGINGGEGSAQNVYVVGGRLDGSVSTSSGSTTAPSDTTGGAEVFGKGPLPIVAYANGGTIPGVGNQDSELIAAMPGEEIISKGPAAEWRPLLKAINSGKLKKFAMGGTVGFGGYSDDMTDAIKPQNWYDWASLAVGGGFAAASMVTPYVNMATSGTIDIGSAMPTVNTSANSIDGITEGLSDLLDEIKRQTRVLQEAVIKNGKTLHVVPYDSGLGAADMLGMRMGR